LRRSEKNFNKKNSIREIILAARVVGKNAFWDLPTKLKIGI
jgi:hypothetical protein